jgi:hypothetical protein
MLATELAKDDLGAVGEAVHQHQPAERNQKVHLAALTQLERAFLSVDTIKRYPGFGHFYSRRSRVKSILRDET